MSAKAKKLSNIYNLNDPKDLFTLLPQEMEIAEVKAMCNNLTGAEKKQMVLEVMDKIARNSSIELDLDLMGTFIDIIADASKGRYALNKVKDD